jgi:hypothetical protein
LIRHRTIGRIDSIILSARMRGLEARPLQRQLQLPLSLISPSPCESVGLRNQPITVAVGAIS